MPKEFERDNIYPMVGYDVIATMQVAEGGGAPWREHVVILNSNSTHYLMFWMEKLADPMGVFIKSFPYSDYGGVAERAYLAALALAVELVKEN